MLNRRNSPERIYEPNIVHNPRTWMGIWTPQGWCVHRKRWGKARVVTRLFSGDGRTTFFPDALRDPDTGRVEWQDDLHLTDDGFTDRGIYPCDPRVEYPVGRPRWAVSHTLLCYPVADHGLWTHEYSWDLTHGHLQTRFRKHVPAELAYTDSNDGMTVTVQGRPISTTIAGNVSYPLPNSAVRGVWTNAAKSGVNFYTRRTIRVMPMHNAVYGITPHVPVVQCHGMYAVLPGDPIGDVFDAETGECRDEQQLRERLKIPTDEPKIAMLMPPFAPAESKVYEGEVSLVADPFMKVDDDLLKHVRARRGARFTMGQVGYGAVGTWDGSSTDVPGYTPNFDLNGDGVIDERDEERLLSHFGRTVRVNLYLHAYFGGDWLTTNVLLDAEHKQGIPAIADYEFGGGYDAQAGVIRLLRTPGPNKPVWVEYFYDAPAEAGTDNIRVHLYREDA